MKDKNYIMLVRHAEAFKNTEKRHGGHGSGLTPKGIKGALKLSKNISLQNWQFRYVMYCSRQQCEESAKIISDKLSIPMRKNQILRPISLGVVDGLSEDEVLRDYPQVHSALEDWRNGDIEINRLDIPNMEDPAVFYERGIRMIHDIKNLEESVILLLSRSLLVLLANILMNRTVEEGGNYREIKWRNSEYALFSFDSEGVNFHVNQSTIRL